mmetsp:Transcript_14089/g.27286  ORF Transcript_14089/g.27286 Transcript_14089/m.27286 type:complete len:208 (-) Transcript_14089:95-718(-)
MEPDSPKAASEPPKTGGDPSGGVPCAPGAAPAARRRRQLPPEKLLELRREQQEALEYQHFSSCGRQIAAVRKTIPVYTFGSPPRNKASPRGGLATADAAGSEIFGGPSASIPSPAGSRTHPKWTETTRTPVLKDFGKESRFLEDAREKPFIAANYNKMDVEFRRKPSWSFGSSGLGQRFGTGSAFSREPQVATTSRLLSFRDLRQMQ